MSNKSTELKENLKNTKHFAVPFDLELPGSVIKSQETHMGFNSLQAANRLVYSVW
jgi:hypothetical protein